MRGIDEGSEFRRHGCSAREIEERSRLLDRGLAQHLDQPARLDIGPHQRFEQIGEAVRKGRLAEPVLLADVFDHDAAFHEFGGVRYLADLVDHAPPAAHALDYARSVVETARRRALLRIGADLSFEASDGMIESRDAAERAEGAAAS